MDYRINYEGTLGDFIREYRQIAKLSSRELSRRVSKSTSYISNIEHGRNKSPSYDKLYLIFKEIGIPENKIEAYLEHFGYYSEERERELMAQEIEKLEMTSDEYNAYLENEKQQILRNPEEFIYNNDPMIKNIADELIEKIASNLKNRFNTIEGFNIIKNLEHVLSHANENKQLYIFLSKFLNNNLQYLDEEGMVRVINSLYKEMNRVEKLNDEWGVAEIKEFIDKIN